MPARPSGPRAGSSGEREVDGETAPIDGACKTGHERLFTNVRLSVAVRIASTNGLIHWSLAGDVDVTRMIG